MIRASLDSFGVQKNEREMNHARTVAFKKSENNKLPVQTTRIDELREVVNTEVANQTRADVGE